MTTLIGWDIQDITPDQPVELMGQYYQRISEGVRDPLAVTALAIEQQDEGGARQAVLVSIDTVSITKDFLEEVRRTLGDRIPGLDPQMVLLNATHVHSGHSWVAPSRLWPPAAKAMRPAAVRSSLVKQVSLAVENAWKARRPGGISSASAYAATGFCRRTLYAGQRAVMYGETNRNDFVGMEAGNDHEVRMLFTWDDQGRLTGVVVNVACPSQVMEAQYVVSADFFGELRKRIRATYGSQVHMLAQVSPAGDQSPRNLPAQAKDIVNYWNEDGLLAVARRLEQAVAEGYASACKCVERALVFEHAVTDILLPIRRAGVPEYRMACAEVKRLTAGHPIESALQELFSRFVEDTHAGEKRQSHGPFDNKDHGFVDLENAMAVVQRFQTQDGTPTFPVELHVLRLGDFALATNPFELYLDYGQMIHARSRAKQTFLVQLACDYGGYLPTARAVAAGGYGSLIINGQVGPDGGQMLVDTIVSAINRLWRER